MALEWIRMSEPDLTEVLEIECQVFPAPWTWLNFMDSLHHGYQSWLLRNEVQRLLGYFLWMPVVDEAHLLNIAVLPALHRQGLGRILLDRMVHQVREQNLDSVLLEVRPSNTRALAIYERYGFVTLGRRKAYYPAVQGQREDAIVMRLEL